MDDWRSLGMGRPPQVPPKPDSGAFLDRLSSLLGLGGPSVLSRMQELERMSQERLAGGGGGPPAPGSPEANLGFDVASNFDMTSGMLVGKGAKFADLGKLEQAKKLAEKGNDAVNIWNKTGWFKSPDGDWRFEIDDSKAKMLRDEQPFWATDDQPLKETVSHPELFANYPRLDDIYVGFGAIEGRKGSFDELAAHDSIRIPEKSTESNQLSTALHEMQHAIQKYENFAQGGTPASNSIVDYELYRRLAGEAEARAVQKRMHLNPEQRARRVPLKDYDLPLSKLIISR